MGLSLYEIDAELEALLNASVDRETGEIVPEALEKIEALEMERDKKAVAIACYIKGQLAEAAATKAYGDAILETSVKPHYARAQIHANHAESLKRYLAAHFPSGHKVTDPKAEIGWRSSDALDVTDEEKIPYNYIRVKTEPDKPAIKAAIKSGVAVPGAALVKRQHLAIK